MKYEDNSKKIRHSTQTHIEYNIIINFIYNIIARRMSVRIIFCKSPETKKPIRTFNMYIQGLTGIRTLTDNKDKKYNIFI